MTVGGAVVNYQGGGGITQIIDLGQVDLFGSNAFVETSGAGGNSALADLTGISGNSVLAVRYGASMSTAGNLTNSANIYVGTGDGGESVLSIGGNLTNTGNLDIGLGSVIVKGTFDNTSGVVAMNNYNSPTSSLMTVGGLRSSFGSWNTGSVQP